MQKKIASKISAGVLSAVLVLQGMFPTVAVMADEISETGSSETVIEETIAETSESEETKVSETSEITAETEPSETEETVPTEPSETSEATVAETSAEQTVPSETAETTATSETTEAKSSVNIVDATDYKVFSDIVSDLSSANRLIVQTEKDIRSKITNATGAYLDGTYVIAFSDKASYNSAISYFEANGIAYAEDGAGCKYEDCCDRYRF